MNRTDRRYALVEALRARVPRMVRAAPPRGRHVSPRHQATYRELLSGSRACGSVLVPAFRGHALVRQASRGRLGAERVAALLAVAQSSVAARRLAPVLALKVQALARQVTALGQEIADLEAAIAAAFATLGVAPEDFPAGGPISLAALLADFARFYNSDRPHRTLSLETPLPAVRPAMRPIRARPVLGGLHHTYARAA
jgi:hypothetical protein